MLTLVWYLAVHAEFILHSEHSRERERELYLDDFMKKTFKTGLHSDAHEPRSWKLAGMIVSTRLHGLMLI